MWKRKLLHIGRNISIIMNHDKQLKQFSQIQEKLTKKIRLENAFKIEDIRLVAGIDLAYWDRNHAVCCIVIVDYLSHVVIETKHCIGEVLMPYIAGYLSFRELPLILKTYDLLENIPDLFMFDGNGYLHQRNMGIATHASFYLNKPTIGIAKNYLKVGDVNYIMPINEIGMYTNIISENKIYGRVLRTNKDVKPIFVSAGNWIDLDTAMEITLSFVSKESRLPKPVRFADIETNKIKKIHVFKN